MPVGSGLAGQLGIAEETYTNEVQTLTGTPSATFTLTFDGATTSSLATNAAAAAIQTALNALPNIGSGGVACSGGPLPSAVTITFSGPLVAGRNVPLLVVQSGITGLTPATTTPGTGYGDGATPSRFYEYESETLTLDVDEVTGGGIRAGSMYQRQDRRRQGNRQAGGDIELNIHNKSFGLWLKHLFGKAPVITTPAGGTTSRDQTFTLGDGAGLSLHAQVGAPTSIGDANNVKPFNYRGCKVVEGEFTLKQGEYFKAKFAIDAKDEEQTTTLAVASYAASTKELDWYNGGLGAALTIAGQNINEADEITLKIARKLNTERFYIGANTKLQPVVKDMFEVTLEVSSEFIDPVQYTRFASESIVPVTFGVNGDAIEAITGGTAYYGLLFTLPAVVWKGDRPATGDPDIIMQKLTGTVVYDGTNELVTGRYRSTDVAA